MKATVIFRDIELDDFVLGIRAAKWLLEREHKDSVISYGEGVGEKSFYVKRNKSSVTVRPI